MLLWSWFCQYWNFFSKSLKDFLLQHTCTCQGSLLTSNRNAFLIGRFLVGKGEVGLFVSVEQSPYSCTFNLDKTRVKWIGCLYFYQEEPHPDVHVLVKFHSLKYIHNMTGTVSQGGNSELYAWILACGALLWLVNVFLARSTPDLWGGLCMNQSQEDLDTCAELMQAAC